MGEPLKTPPSAIDSAPSAADSPRYCRACNYNLQAHGGGKSSVLSPPSSSLPTRCPECGRAFDPANPKTYRSHPRRGWLHYAKRAACAFGAIVLLLAAVWLWFFWGWYSERQALLALQVNPTPTSGAYYEPIFTTWPKEHLGPAGFVLDRVKALDLNSSRVPADYAPLAQLTRLERLGGMNCPIEDLSPLAGLAELRTLDLRKTRVRNLAPLAGLRQLRWLMLDGTPATDLTPLAGLTNLWRLDLRDTGITDLTPLAHLPKLEDLLLTGTPVTNLGPLEACKSLRALILPKETISPEYAGALLHSLPECTIICE